MRAERVREWTAPWVAEGREQGLKEGIEHGIEQGRAEERRLLRRLAARKFTTETAPRLSARVGSSVRPEAPGSGRRLDHRVRDRRRTARPCGTRSRTTGPGRQ